MAKQKPLAELSPAYRKRLESHIRRGTLTEGAPRAVARGHKNESEEKLRRRVKAHMLVQLAMVATKRPVNADRIDAAAKRMSPDMMRAILKLYGPAMQAGAAANSEDTWLIFWDGEPPDDFDDKFNPFWYGAL